MHLFTIEKLLMYNVYFTIYLTSKSQNAYFKFSATWEEFRIFSITGLYHRLLVMKILLRNSMSPIVCYVLYMLEKFGHSRKKVKLGYFDSAFHEKKGSFQWAQQCFYVDIEQLHIFCFSFCFTGKKKIYNIR